MMAVHSSLATSADPSVPSSLVGEGQGGGYPTTRALDSIKTWLDSMESVPGLPLSPALPHKGGGSRPHAGQQLRLGHTPAEAVPS